MEGQEPARRHQNGDEEEEEEIVGPIRLTPSRRVERETREDLEGSGEEQDEADRQRRKKEAESDWERTLARLRAEAMPTTHIIAIDGSPDSDRAFSWAVRSLPRHDRLHLIHGTRHTPLPGLEVTLLERRSAEEQRRRLNRKTHALAQYYADRCAEAEVARNSTDPEHQRELTLLRTERVLL